MFGKADPYCKVVIGTQEFSTRPHKVTSVADRMQRHNKQLVVQGTKKYAVLETIFSP